MVITRRRVILVFVATLVGVAASPGTAVASTGWQLLERIPTSATVTGSAYNDVLTTAQGGTWAVGGRDLKTASGVRRHPLVAHWTGQVWTHLYPPMPEGATDADLTEVEPRSPQDVWVAGTADPVGSYVEHLLGTTWHVYLLKMEISHVAIISATSVWVLGVAGGQSPVGVYAHWNGASWSTGTLPAIPFERSVGRAVAAAWCPAGGEFGYKASLLHFNGTAWTVFPTPTIPLLFDADSYLFNDVVQTAPNRVWVTVSYEQPTPPVGGLAVWQWNGHSWHRPVLQDGPAPYSMAPDGSGGLWIMTVSGGEPGPYLHYRPGAELATLPPPSFAAGATFQAISIAQLSGGSGFWAAGLPGTGINEAEIARYGPVSGPSAPPIANTGPAIPPAALEWTATALLLAGALLQWRGRPREGTRKTDRCRDDASR